MPPSAPRDVRCRHAINWKIRRDIVIRPATQPCLKGHGGNGPTVLVKAEAGLAEPAEPDSAESAGKQQPQKRGTRRTAPLPAWAMRSAHCPLRPGHCPLHQRIVRMRITPLSVACVPKETRLVAVAVARPVLPPRALTPRAVAPSLLLLAPSRRAFALSFCRSPSLSAVTTTAVRSTH